MLFCKFAAEPSVRLVIPVQYWKALLPRTCSLLDIVTLVKPEQSLNALFPITMQFCVSSEVSDEQPRNASEPMVCRYWKPPNVASDEHP